MMWTEQRVETLRAMWLEDYSFGRIAQELGDVTRNAVIGKAHRLGLRRETNTHDPGRTLFLPPKRSPRIDGIGLARKCVNKRKKQRAEATSTTEAISVPELPKPHVFLGVTFDQLEDGMCKYPQGDVPNMLFCGSPTEDGESYCAHCHDITHSYAANLSDENRAKRRRENAKRYFPAFIVLQAFGNE